MQPARRVVTRSPHRSVGLIACSWLQEHSIEYESQLERRFLQRSLLLPSIRRIYHQPFKIPYVADEKEYHYTPDFLLVFHDGTKIVVEVKPETFVKKHRNKLNAAKIFFSSEKISFFVITDKQIDKGQAARHAAFLLRYARGEIEPQSWDRCQQTMKGRHALPTVAELMHEASVSFADILHLVARGRLYAHKDLFVDSKTILSNSDQGEQNGDFFFRDWFDASPW